MNHSPAVQTTLREKQTRNIWWRTSPALGLFFLAPLVGEYLLGNISIKHIVGLIVLAPMYGGGALLVREFARRSKRGWPTIMLLALAYGVAEPALFDHSLFNMSFDGHNIQNETYIPVLGIDISNTIAFCVGHAVWSISIPIAIMESFVPNRRTTPWLGNLGLLFVGILFLLGSFLIFKDHWETEQFLPSAMQFIISIVIIISLIGISFAIRPSPRSHNDHHAPNTWLVGVVAFIVSSLFFVLGENWMSVVIKIMLIGMMIILVKKWSNCSDWNGLHRLSLAGGALLTYAWGGFLCATLVGNTGIVDRIGNIIFACGAVIVLLIAVRQTHQEIFKTNRSTI
ncbi:hypothetical protein [Shimazuella kribbensis]|uniref:hypothetical protein n=1 Tax=Shimazuella kribbensis TaxID=139808 RepID=UPI0003FA84EF|nr:hypothetical protein [Shimazuella kribbensis]